MKVGFIGLGIMGRPMAKNLLNAGVELLVSDLNKEAVADVVATGAKEATYAEIGEQCGRIIIMVPSGAISNLSYLMKTVLHLPSKKEPLYVI